MGALRDSPSDVDAGNAVVDIVPVLVQGRNVALWASRVVERDRDPVTAYGEGGLSARDPPKAERK